MKLFKKILIIAFLFFPITLMTQQMGEVNGGRRTLSGNPLENSNKTKPVNWRSFNEKIALSRAQKKEFLEKGLILLKNKEFKTFQEAYYLYSKNPSIPIFVTSDVMMHLFHQTYSALIVEVENYHLIGFLKDFIDKLYNSVKRRFLYFDESSAVKLALRKLVTSLGIAKALIYGQNFFEDSEIDEKIVSNIDFMLSNISHQSKYKNKLMFHYNLIKVKGHYEKDIRLKNYYQALKWLQENVFIIAQTTNKNQELVNLKAALVLSWIIEKDSKLKTIYHRISHLFRGLGGDSKYITLDSLYRKMLQRYNEFYHRGVSLLEDHQVCTDFHDFLSQQGESCQNILFFPSVHQLDFDILEKNYRDNPERQRVPGLDIASVLFNSVTAVNILRLENDFDFMQRIQDLQSEYQTRLTKNNSDYVSLYWLNTIAALNNGSSNINIFQKINTHSRNLSILYSQLACWTEFHYSSSEYKTIRRSTGSDLLASSGRSFIIPEKKKSGIMIGGDIRSRPTLNPRPLPTTVPTSKPLPSPTISPGYNFVEPNPPFFESLSALISSVLEVIENSNLYVTESVLKLIELKNTIKEFELIARKHKNNQRLTINDKLYIDSWGKNIGTYLKTLWPESEKDIGPQLISDFYANNDLVFHSALGDVRPMLLHVKPNGENQSYVAIGFIKTYYELTRNGYKVLTNKDWSEIINNRSTNYPNWIESIYRDD